jgi:hypothetical protein
MRESRVEINLRDGVKALGGIALKIYSMSFTGLPDRLVLAYPGRAIFVETKAPGKKPNPRQRIVHQLLERLGFPVKVIDTPEKVVEFLRSLREVATC